jgi:hypothetical protein
MKLGTAFEQLAAALFGGLAAADLEREIEVRRNVTLKGKTTSHEIDVYWRLRIANIRYDTLIQAKDWAKEVDQGEVLKFKAVLDDLPHQPRGVMVSRLGFQKGAIQTADGNGILLFTIAEAPAAPRRVTMTTESVAVLRVERRPTPIVAMRGDTASGSNRADLFYSYRIFTPRNIELGFRASAALSDFNVSAKGRTSPIVPSIIELFDPATQRSERLSNLVQRCVTDAIPHPAERWVSTQSLGAPHQLRSGQGAILFTDVEAADVSFDLEVSSGANAFQIPALTDYFVRDVVSKEATLVRLRADLDVVRETTTADAAENRSTS